MRFDPVGQGQFKAVVNTIMEAESQPLKQLEARKQREETKLKLFQEFKGKFGGINTALAEISSFNRLREFKVDLGDGKEQASVTIDKDKAQPGSYLIEVQELAARTSVLSNGHESPDDNNLGIGFITMKSENGDDVEIFIDDDRASLRGIAQAINSRADLPVRASVMKDSSDTDEPWKLIITGKKDGQTAGINFPELYFLDGKNDLYIDDERQAQNAIIKVDGFDIELDSNDVTEFLPGVNLHLKQAKPGQPFTLTITEDLQKVAGKMKGLVESVNGILTFINKQNQVDEKSDTRTTFAGDTSLQGIEYRLRNLLHEGFRVVDPKTGNENLVFLHDLGVEFDKSGMMSFKEDKFTKFVEKDFDTLAQGVSGEYGFAFQLREVLGQYTRPGDGLLAVRENGMRNRIRDIDSQIDMKTRSLERRQHDLTQQFARLSSTVSGMQQQQQQLSAALGGGGGNPIAQLLGG